MRTLIVLVCLSFICAGDIRVINLTPLKDDQVVEAFVGEELVIKLSGNKSTGYEWVIKNLNLEESFAGFTHEKTTYIGSDSNTRKMGLGGHYFIYLKPQLVGNHVVRLSYQRPFEPFDTVQSFEFTISAKSKSN